jgi:hypothetical protein
VITIVRHIALLLVATVVSWWVFLYSPNPATPSRHPAPLSPPVTITPRFERRQPTEVEPATHPPARPKPTSSAPPPEPDEAEDDRVVPPPPELGAPEGVVDPEAVAESRDSEPTPPEDKADTKNEPHPIEQDADLESASNVAELMKDKSLLQKARDELTGKVRKGFATVLLATPEDQVHIARFFGEKLVLIPRRAIDPKRADPIWFRVGTGAPPSVDKVRGRPPLENYRQYRDLFDYEYSRLPVPLRTLRKSVLQRREIYLFAALIPATEWAAVIGRRNQAIAESGHDLDQVRRIVMRYIGSPDRGYDIVVEEVVLADGSRFRPNENRRKQP